jgi:hypothetical protein
MMTGFELGGTFAGVSAKDASLAKTVLAQTTTVEVAMRQQTMQAAIREQIGK